jgi:uncharacterized protein YdeI (YjbR/CyaY-like superfamily)
MTRAAKPTFFATPEDFRRWLEKHHRTAPELLVGFYKKGSGRPSMTWPESVDQALCVGWIDGIRKRVDEDSYTIRFTPRRPGSNWSAVNIKRVAELETLGLMRQAGQEAFAKRTEAKSAIYTYEQRQQIVLTNDYESRFRANKKAWGFFEAQALSYRRVIVYWIMSAKKEETRLARLAKAIQTSAKERRL